MFIDFSDKKILLGLSGGINSMAVLCWLKLQPVSFYPKELHLFYAHFDEHSSDTLAFVCSGIEYAKKYFNKVFIKITYNNLLDYFYKNRMIPHSRFSPCSRELKIEPMTVYFEDNDLDLDLIGYVKEESKRYLAQKNNPSLSYKVHPIIHWLNEDCFNVVKQEIGWYPNIYDIKDDKGKRIFSHNNCLPCKNISQKDLDNVKKYFPEYWLRAEQMAERIGKYWGRLPVIQNICDNCSFD